MNLLISRRPAENYVQMWTDLAAHTDVCHAALLLLVKCNGTGAGAGAAVQTGLFSLHKLPDVRGAVVNEYK